MKKIAVILLALVLALPAFAQVGRYKNIKLLYPGYSLKLDTATGEYTTVKWNPVNKDGEKVGVDLDSLISNAAESLKRFFKELQEDLENTPDSLVVI